MDRDNHHIIFAKTRILILQTIQLFRYQQCADDIRLLCKPLYPIDAFVTFMMLVIE